MSFFKKSVVSFALMGLIGVGAITTSYAVDDFPYISIVNSAFQEEYYNSVTETEEEVANIIVNRIDNYNEALDGEFGGFMLDIEDNEIRKRYHIFMVKGGYQHYGRINRVIEKTTAILDAKSTSSGDKYEMAANNLRDFRDGTVTNLMIGNTSSFMDRAELIFERGISHEDGSLRVAEGALSFFSEEAKVEDIYFGEELIRAKNTIERLEREVALYRESANMDIVERFGDYIIPDIFTQIGNIDTGISVNKNIWNITFNKAIDENSLDRVDVWIDNIDEGLKGKQEQFTPISRELTNNGRTLTVVFNEGFLKGDTAYQFHVLSSGLRAVDGSELELGGIKRFITK